jgi:hypothetical protein
VEMMEEEEEGGEEQAFGRERQAKVSMGARHAPVPLPGPSLAPHGSSLDRFPYMALLGAGTASERTVALPISGATPVVAQLACLALGSCTLQRASYNNL